MKTIYKNINKKLALLILLTSTSLLFGCSIGPHALKSTHLEYNKAVRISENEELLLNLVRLKYHEPPQFMEVSGILAQFSFNTALSGSVGKERGDPKRLLDGFVSYSDNPTITFHPQSDQEFYKGLLSPISIKTIYLLINSGWDIERVLRLTVEEINGLENAKSAGGFTPAVAPPYQNYKEMAKILQEFWDNNQLSINSEEEIIEISDWIPADTVNAADLVGAAKEGYRFKSDGQEKKFQLIEKKKVYSLSFSKDTLNDQRRKRLDQLLGLTPGKLNYKIIFDSLSSENDENSPAIYIKTRTLLSVMRYLSEAVNVPQDHFNSGVVRTTLDRNSNHFDWSQMLGDIFKIDTTSTVPQEASVAVQYKHTWFYIGNSDLDSKTTFGILVNLFHLQTSGASGATPLLTLPVN